MNPIDRIEQLRARVAELEKEREHAQQCVKFHSENSVARHARAEQAEQRNAELVAALRGALGWLEKGGVRSAHVALAHALARAESATPAKHPDTERLVTLLESALKSFAAMPEANPSHTRDGIWALWTDGCNTLRDAIDAARKQQPTP